MSGPILVLLVIVGVELALRQGLTPLKTLSDAVTGQAVLR